MGGKTTSKWLTCFKNLRTAGETRSRFDLVAAKMEAPWIHEGKTHRVLMHGEAAQRSCALQDFLTSKTKRKNSDFGLKRQRLQFFLRGTSTPHPDTFEKYRDTPSISIAILLQKYALFLAESTPRLSVLGRSVPKTLRFAFGSRLRSKTRVLRRRLPNGKPQERLRFRDLRGKTLAFKKRIAIISCVLEPSLGLGLAFGSFAFKKRCVWRLSS